MKFINVTKEEIEMANKLKVHLLSLITKDTTINTKVKLAKVNNA